MDNAEIHHRINALIDEEHQLRQKLAAGEIGVVEEQARLDELEASLDQAWDLLRQRHALREFGEDPDEAEVRPVDVVENYRQ